MSREIKFRVWNGIEMVYDVTVGKFGTFYVNPGNNGLDERDSASLTPFTTKYSDTTPVMQYTGLHDKEGKEIYEGDILKTPNNNWGVVKFHENYFGLTVSEKYVSLYTYDWMQSCEIIGNIHSNPELLKK